MDSKSNSHQCRLWRKTLEYKIIYGTPSSSCKSREHSQRPGSYRCTHFITFTHTQTPEHTHMHNCSHTCVLPPSLTHTCKQTLTERHLHTDTYTHTHTDIYTHTHIHTQTCTDACVHAHKVWACVHAHSHACTHTHARTHTHAQTPFHSSAFSSAGTNVLQQVKHVCLLQQCKNTFHTAIFTRNGRDRRQVGVIWALPCWGGTWCRTSPLCEQCQANWCPPPPVIHLWKDTLQLGDGGAVVLWLASRSNTQRQDTRLFIHP